MNAWAAATYLVQRGVPFRLAHETDWQSGANLHRKKL